MARFKLLSAAGASVTGQPARLYNYFGGARFVSQGNTQAVTIQHSDDGGTVWKTTGTLVAGGDEFDYTSPLDRIRAVTAVGETAATVYAISPN